MDPQAELDWMRQALGSGTVSAVLWRGVRDTAGNAIDLEVVEGDSRFADWVARPHAELPGLRYSALLPSGVRHRLPALLGALASGEPGQLLFEPVARPGRPGLVELRFVPCGHDLIFTQLFDVTEREARVHAAEAAGLVAEAERSRFEAALNALPQALAIYQLVRDAQGGVNGVRVLFVNDAGAAPTGRSSDGWRGATLEEFYPEGRRTGLIDELCAVASERRPHLRIEEADSVRGWHGSFENSIVPFGPDLVLSVWRPLDGAGPNPLATTADTRDDLTSVMTRGAFLRWLDHRLAIDPDHAGVLLLVDIDDFGALNDRIGHHRADALLATLASGMAALSPRAAAVGRTGPDEFALLLPTLSDGADVHRFFARIATLLAQLAKQADVARLHVSGGFAHLKAAPTAFELLRACDTALRASLAEGGARVTGYSTELRAEMLRRSRLTDDILRGLNANEFALAFQPIVSLDDGEPWGVEALVRWRHPELGLLLPGRFITGAEASGLIVELGDWVVDATVAQLAAYPLLSHATCNVSSRQILQDDIPNLVARALEHHGVAPARLVIEITESAFLPDSGRVRSQMRDLRKMGVQVALDDFGSGYSSIAYLDRIPVDVVKLDAFFLDGELDARRLHLLRSTASMIRALGATALIEHVETDEQRELAREAGVQLGQGYLFGAPQIPGEHHSH